MHDKWQAALYGWTHREGEWTEERAVGWRKQVREELFATNDYAWFLAALEEGPGEGHRSFGLLRWLLLDLNPIPDMLFAPLLRAAVYDPDPSFNKWFIEICLEQWGGRKVNEELWSYTRGTDTEKAGVSNAFYWSIGLARREVLDDLRQKIHEWHLQEFVHNEDLQVRQCLISALELDSELYPEHLRSLISEAVAIARGHTDSYIRHRIEIQLGSSGPLYPLPKQNRS